MQARRIKLGLHGWGVVHFCVLRVSVEMAALLRIKLLGCSMCSSARDERMVTVSCSCSTVAPWHAGRPRGQAVDLHALQTPTSLVVPLPFTC